MSPEKDSNELGRFFYIKQNGERVEIILLESGLPRTPDGTWTINGVTTKVENGKIVPIEDPNKT